MSSPVVTKEFWWKFRDGITQEVAKARQIMSQAADEIREEGSKIASSGEDWKKMGTDAKEAAQETSQSLDSMKEKLLSYQHAATDASKNIREQFNESKQVLNGIPKQKTVSVKAQIDSNKLKSFEEQLQGLPPHKQILLNLKGNYYAQLENAKKKADETKRSFSDLKGTMAGTFVGGAVLGGVYAIGNGLKEAAATGMQFDTEQQKMLATWHTLTGSASQAKGMVNTINDLSIKTGQATDTINELEQGFYHLHSRKSEADDMTKAMLNMGDAVGLSGQQLTQVEQDMVHSLATGKVTQGELNQIGMYFPMIDERMAKHFHTTVAGMRKMASAGKITGKDLEEVFEQMGNSGKYKHAVDNMMQTTWGSMRTIRSMVPRLIGAMEEGLFQARNPLVGAIAKWTTDPATKKGFQNFGKGVADAFNGLNEIVVNLVKPFEGLNRIVGAVLKQFASGVWQGMKASFETMAAAVKLVSDMLSGLFGWIGKLLSTIGRITGLSTAFKGAGSAAKGLGAAVGAVLGPIVALRGAIAAYNSVVLTYTAVSKIAAAASKLFAGANGLLDASLLANPITWVVAGVIALAAAFYEAYKHCKTFRDGVNKAFEWISKSAKSVLSFFKNNWKELLLFIANPIVGGFALAYKNSKSFRSKINSLAKGIKDVFTGKAGWEKDLKKNFSNMQKEYQRYSRNQTHLQEKEQKEQQKRWNNFWSGLTKKTRSAWNDISKHTQNGVENVRKSMQSRSKSIEKTWNNTWSTIGRFTQNAWKDIQRASSNGMEDVHGAVSSGLSIINRIWNAGWNTFSNIFRGIWNGIKQAAQDGMNGVISVINAGISGINKVWSFFTGHGTGLKELGKVHFAQGGTVHRHLSVINDGDGPDWKELVQTPDGNLFMSQERNWTGFLPEGTRVYSGAETRQIMNAVGVSHYATGGIVGAQHFADGGIIGEGIDWAKGSLENIGSWLGDKFSALEDFLADPLKATKGLLEKATSGLYKGLGNFADVAHGAMDKLTQPIADWFKKGLEKLEAQFESGGASPDLIRAAAAKMHVAISGGDISHIMNVIKHESGGNARAINNWDSNAKAGHPSKGILQFIDGTFRKYAVAGHTNIYSPFDQLLAMFNDTTWRSDLTLGGWGPTGGRRFATGGEVFGLTNAIIGDNPEHHEFVLNPYAVSAEPLLDRAFEATAQAQPANSSTGNGNSKLDQMIDLLGKVLVAIESQDTDIYLDGEKVTDDVSKRQGKTWRLRKN